MNSYSEMFDLENVEIKIVRIFLIAFIILLGYQALQFINTRRIDKKHRELLVIRNQSVGEVQNLLIQSSTIQRKLLNMALSENPDEVVNLQQMVETAAVNNENSLEAIEAAAFKLNSPLKPFVSDLKNASDDYKMIYTSYINAINAGEIEKALEIKNSRLRPAYEAYQDLQQRSLVIITDDLIRQSNTLGNYAAVSGWILFFVGLVPFIFAISKLVYLSLFIKLKSSRVSVHRSNSETKE